MTPSPVKEAATELGIAVTHDMDDVVAAAVELAVVVAYGRIIPSRLLDLVPTVNLHFSLLPRWPGPPRSNGRYSPATTRPACV